MLAYRPFFWGAECARVRVRGASAATGAGAACSARTQPR